jgi:hypothetical protein
MNCGRKSVLRDKRRCGPCGDVCDAAETINGSTVEAVVRTARRGGVCHTTNSSFYSLSPLSL